MPSGFPAIVDRVSPYGLSERISSEAGEVRVLIRCLLGIGCALRLIGDEPSCRLSLTPRQQTFSNWTAGRRSRNCVPKILLSCATSLMKGSIFAKRSGTPSGIAHEHNLRLLKRQGGDIAWKRIAAGSLVGCRPFVKNERVTPQGITGPGLEPNRAGDLECVPLKGRSALEFMKVLNTDARLLLR